MQALRSLGTLQTIPTFPPDKPYRLSFLKSLLAIVWQALRLDLPPDTTHVVILFPDNENVLVARLYRWIHRRNFLIIFDAFISLYDTYVYNKPLPVFRYPLAGSLLKGWLRWYEHFLFNQADVCLADTARHGQYLQQLMGVTRPFRTLRLAADEDVFQPTQLNNQAFWQEAPLRLLWYGHLSAMHGMGYILRALDLLPPGLVQCTIVGNLPDYSTLRERLIASGKLVYRPVQHPHYLSLDQIGQLVKQHHVMLGIFGDTAKAKNVIANKEVEALASARCLVTRQAPREYLRDHDNCLMVDHHDPQALSQALSQLASNRSLVQHLARQGRADYQQFASQATLTGRLKQLLA